MDQAPTITSRVLTITMDLFDTYPNMFDAHCYPKVFIGFITFMHLTEAVVAAALGGQFRGVEGGMKGQSGSGGRGGGGNDDWRPWR